MKKYGATLILFLLALSAYTQAVGYDIFGTQTNPNRAWFPLITLDTLQEAKTLQDINRRFRPSWVASYISVELAANCGNEIKSASGKDDSLTPEQLSILRSADNNCTIEVAVDYIPKNNLQHNPPRQMNFTLNILPIHEAKYPGGYPALKDFLKENIIDAFPESTVNDIALIKVRFNIDEKGEAVDAKVVTPSGDDQVDRFIIEALCTMPAWQPAENAAGEKIAQEFEFSMGTDLLRCDYNQY